MNPIDVHECIQNNEVGSNDPYIRILEFKVYILPSNHTVYILPIIYIYLIIYILYILFSNVDILGVGPSKNKDENSHVEVPSDINRLDVFLIFSVVKSGPWDLKAPFIL